MASPVLGSWTFGLTCLAASTRLKDWLGALDDGLVVSCLADAGAVDVLTLSVEADDGVAFSDDDSVDGAGLFDDG